MKNLHYKLTSLILIIGSVALFIFNDGADYYLDIIAGASLALAITFFILGYKNKISNSKLHQIALKLTSLGLFLFLVPLAFVFITNLFCPPENMCGMGYLIITPLGILYAILSGISLLLLIISYFKSQKNNPKSPIESKQGYNKVALIGLIFSLISIVHYLVGLLSLIFGIIALIEIKKTNQKGKALAIINIIMGLIWGVGLGLILSII